MYWENHERRWIIGEDKMTKRTDLMKMQSGTTLKCPADPLDVGASKRYWQRKNAVGGWVVDKTATVKCGN